jgi:hypothetical protein
MNNLAARKLGLQPPGHFFLNRRIGFAKAGRMVERAEQADQSTDYRLLTDEHCASLSAEFDETNDRLCERFRIDRQALAMEPWAPWVDMNVDLIEGSNFSRFLEVFSPEDLDRLIDAALH